MRATAKGILLLFPLFLLAAPSFSEGRVDDDGGDTYKLIPCQLELAAPFGNLTTGYTDDFDGINLKLDVEIDRGHGEVRHVTEQAPEWSVYDGHGPGVGHADVFPGDEVFLYLRLENNSPKTRRFSYAIMALEAAPAFEGVKIRNDKFKALSPDTQVGHWRTIRCDGGHNNGQNSAITYVHTITVKAYSSRVVAAVWTAPDSMGFSYEDYFELKFTNTIGTNGPFKRALGPTLRYWQQKVTPIH